MKRAISLGLLAGCIAMSLLNIFIYYTEGGSVLEIMGGLLIEVLQVGLLLVLFLLRRRCRERFPRLMLSFFTGILSIGWVVLYVVGDYLLFWPSRFPRFLAFLLAFGGLIPGNVVFLLQRGKVVHSLDGSDDTFGTTGKEKA